jgi:hypothetical protein
LATRNTFTPPALREALIKAGFPNFSFPWLGMSPLRWKIAADTSRSQASYGLN